MIRPEFDTTPITSSVVTTAEHADKALPLTVGLLLLSLVLLLACLGLPELVRLIRRRQRP